MAILGFILDLIPDSFPTGGGASTLDLARGHTPQGLPWLPQGAPLA